MTALLYMEKVFAYMVFSVYIDFSEELLGIHDIKY